MDANIEAMVWNVFPELSTATFVVVLQDIGAPKSHIRSDRQFHICPLCHKTGRTNFIYPAEQHNIVCRWHASVEFLQELIELRRRFDAELLDLLRWRVRCEQEQEAHRLAVIAAEQERFWIKKGGDDK